MWLLFACVEQIPVASEANPDPLPQSLTPRPDGTTSLSDPFVIVTLDTGESEMLLELFPGPVFRVDGAPRVGSISRRLGFLGEGGTDDVKQFVLSDRSHVSTQLQIGRSILIARLTLLG